MPRYGFVPDTRPHMADSELTYLLDSKGISLDLKYSPIWIIGIRGYYKNSMGVPDYNDRGIYDDAIFIYSQPIYRSFNANTDPGKYREGYGTDDETKGIATLEPGLWNVHKLDYHRPIDGRDSYLALCQRGRSVKVIRDGIGGQDYPDIGNFGINIHRGGLYSVSSLGCQTIYPTQWDDFITIVKDLAIDFFKNEWNNVYIPYALIKMA